VYNDTEQGNSKNNIYYAIPSTNGNPYHGPTIYVRSIDFISAEHIDYHLKRTPHYHGNRSSHDICNAVGSRVRSIPSVP
jgi:hypothetical protein